MASNEVSVSVGRKFYDFALHWAVPSIKAYVVHSSKRSYLTKELRGDTWNGLTFGYSSKRLAPLILQSKLLIVVTIRLDVWLGLRELMPIVTHTVQDDFRVQRTEWYLAVVGSNGGLILSSWKLGKLTPFICRTSSRPVHEVSQLVQVRGTPQTMYFLCSKKQTSQGTGTLPCTIWLQRKKGTEVACCALHGYSELSLFYLRFERRRCYLYWDKGLATQVLRFFINQCAQYSRKVDSCIGKWQCSTLP